MPEEKPQTQEVVIYLEGNKSPGVPVLSQFKIEGEDFSDSALDSKELEEKILRLAEKNPGLVIRNKIPYSDLPNAVMEVTELDAPLGGHQNRYRPLTEEEIPEKVKPYILEEENKMSNYTIRLVEVGMEMDRKEPDKFYFENDGIRYEIETGGDAKLSPSEILQLAHIATPNLLRMAGRTLEIRIEIEEKGE